MISTRKTEQKNTNMNKFLILIVSVAVSTASMGLCRAQSDAPYTEGPVWTITMVKAKAGMTDEYLKGLAKTFTGAIGRSEKAEPHHGLQNPAR